MTALIVSLFLACLLPILSKIPLVIAQNKQAGGYDNNNPRAQQAKLKGFGARALAGHQNSFESLVIFAPAILTAIATHNTNMSIIYLAYTYLISRVVYHALYLADLATMRSLVWAIGLLSSLAILYLCF